MGTTDLERLALGVLLPAFSSYGDEELSLVGEGLGGVCLFGGNTEHGTAAVRTLTDAVHDARADAVVAVDEEGGDVTRLHTATGSPVPGAAALGAVDDLDVTRAVGAAVGSELAAVGIDLDFGPVADVNSNADNPVIGVRSFGDDAQSVAAHVAAWTTGLQGAGAAACAKHFPGHGDTHQDSHLALPTVDVSARVLHERELVPFVAAVDAGVAAVMTSHLVVPAVDPAWPATLSPPVLRLLRDRLGFAGAVVSDALDMAGASAGRGVPAAAVRALAAGCDLLCLGADKDLALVREVQAAVVAAVRAGELSADALAVSVERVRALAWSRRPASPGPVADVPDDAAARALRVEGVLPRLTDAAVVRVDTPASIAIGSAPWGLPADLVVAPADPSGLLATGAAATRPLVVQVRDGHLHPAVRGLLADLARREAPVLVVEWGWPGPMDVALPRVVTHGWSQPARRAVEALLRESSGWTA